MYVLWQCGSERAFGDHLTSEREWTKARAAQRAARVA